MNALGQQTFNNLVKIGLINADGTRRFGEYAKLKSNGFMDLVVELLSEKEPFYKLSIAHYGEQIGDLMADPDMEIMVGMEKKQVCPMMFQNDYIGMYQEVYDSRGNRNVRLHADLLDFLSTWTHNLIEQGFVYDLDSEC